MKRIYYYFSTLLLSGLLAGACTEETEQSGDGNATGVPVKHEISIATMPIESVVAAPATRSVAAEDEMMEMNCGAASTRATTEKNELESKIHSLYILQFAGTTNESKLLKVSGDLHAELEANGKIDYEFATNGAVQRVYVVANMSVGSYTVGSTTLSAFEAGVVAFTPVTSVPNGGLPMVGSQDFNPLTDAPSTYSLKTPLTKLTFGVDFVAGVTTTSDLKIVLKNLPNGYCMKQATLSPSEVSQQPSSGMTYTGTLDLIASKTSPVTYYLPANLAGRNSGLEKVSHRNTFFAPENAMSVEITGTIKGQANTRFYLALGDGTAQDFNVAPNSAYTITTTIKGINEAADLRVGGDITDLNAQLGGKTSNCYVITESNKRFAFNATVMGNGVETPAHTKTSVLGDLDFPAITPEPLDPHSAAVLWQTNNTMTFEGNVVNSAVVANGKMIIKTAEKTGNAVVAAYNSNDTSGDVIWSWHIWRTNSTPFAAQTLAKIESTSGNFEATGTTEISDLQIMDRNLGALSATPQDNGSIGLTYQWGRKDPFPGGADFNQEKVTMAIQPAGIINTRSFEANTTAAQSIATPATYFAGKQGEGIWCDRNDNLWGTPVKDLIRLNLTDKYSNGEGNKSIYDPCPVGWRVPQNYALANARKTTFDKGYSLNILTNGSSSWFPASGIGLTKDVVSVGIVGYYWLAGPLAQDGCPVANLSLMGSGVISANYTLPICMLGAVRCMKE